MKQRMIEKSKILTVALALSIPIVTVGAAPSGKVFVSNSNNAGPGSFRAAILQANLNQAITHIEFRDRVSTVFLESTVWFTGAQDLTIDGKRATLDGANAAGPAFFMNGGGDLAVSNLTVRNAPDEGIKVEVPGTATGTVRVSLFNVAIIDNDGHGVLVNDQVDPTTQETPDGDPIQPNENGSAASVDVSVVNTRFIRNGYSVSDRDGLRVNEGGEGDLIITIKYSLAQDNAADGIEVDERGAGDVHVDMLGSRVTGNGPFDPLDLDDGFDIDEYNDGSIVGEIVFSAADDNFEEGFDFNENNLGDLRVNMRLVDATGNGEEGIDLEEDDDFAGGGELVTAMNGIRTSRNGGGDGGLKIREKGDGNLDVTLKNILSNDNFGSGIFVRETEGGNSDVEIDRAIATGNKFYNDGEDDFLGHGIELREGQSGSLTASVSNATSSANDGFGVSGSAGNVTLTHVGFGGGNALGDTGGGATFVILP